MERFIKGIHRHDYFRDSFLHTGATYLLFLLIGVVALTGLFIILGWHFNLIHLLQVKHSITPAYVTGCYFTLFSLALLFIYNQRPKWALYVTLSTIILSLSISLPYIYHSPINWSQVWLDVASPKETILKRPMSPLTLAGVIFSSLSLLSMTTKYPKRNHLIFGIVTSQMTIMIGFIALMLYFLDFSYAQQIANLPPIALVTSIGLLLIGKALIILLSVQSTKLKIDLEKPKTYLLFIQSILSTIILAAFIYLSEFQTQQRHINQELSNISFEIGQNMNRFDKIAYHFSERWKKHRLLSLTHLISNLKYESTLVINSFDEVEGVIFIDDRFHEFTHIFTPEIPEHLIPSLVNSIKKRIESTKEPIQNFGLVTLLPSIFIHVTKVSFGAHRFGLIGLIINVEKSFYNHIRPKILEEYTIRVSSPHHQLFFNDIPNPSNLKATVNTKILNQDWTITAQPSQNVARSWQTIFPCTVLILGFFGSFLMFFFFKKSFLVRSYSRDLEKYRDLLIRSQKIARVGVWIWNLKEDIIWVSDELQEILGFDGTNLIAPSKRFFELIHPSDAQHLESEIRQIKSGKPAIFESFRFIRSDQHHRYLRLDARVSEKTDNYPTEIVGILQDITDYKELESRLQQAKKLELIGQLTGGIAHDFNNILMVIQGNLELIDLKMDENSVDKKRIKSAISASERASELIKRLLSFSRKQPLSPSRLNLTQFLNNSIILLKRPLGEAIELALKIDENLWDVEVDSSQLEAAIINLIINARDAMNNRGKITIRAENVTFNETYHTRFHTLPLGSYVKISVQDNGQGIDEAIIDRVVEPFFTTKAVGKGSGLGLSMVYGFIGESRGGLDIISDIGHGTTIVLYLPKSTQIQEDPFKGENNPLKAHAINHPSTILVVEDEDDVREVTVESLLSMGYQVLQASNGEQALSILKNHKSIDLLFTDVVMPGSYSGPELAKEAQHFAPNLKVLLCSGYPRKEYIEGYFFIKKPYTIRALAEMIKEVLEKKK